MGERLRVAVCDDDPTALKLIEGGITDVFSRHDVAATVALFPSAEELWGALETRRYDLLLLDIDMPGMDGISLGRELRERRDQVDILFISNREDLVFDSLRVNPVGFIRKSRFLEDMPGVVGQYLEVRRQRSRRSVVVLKEGASVRPVPVSSICYVEGQRKHQLVHVEGEERPITLLRTMGELEEELSGEGFIRIHKGYLVNYRFIQMIEGGEVLLSTGEHLPMSRRKDRETKDRLMELVQANDHMVF